MATITLKATVRDFRASHPDFETTRFPLEQGVVQPILGSDKKPVYNGDPQKGTQSTSGFANFAQWFNTDPNQAFNKEIQSQLVLSDDGTPGIYTLKRDEFFAADGQGFGNLRQELFTDDTMTTLSAIGLEVQRKKGTSFDLNSYKTRLNPNRQPDTQNPAADYNRNFHYTLEASAPFTYQGNEVLEFYGDDDLWIFIDGKLVVDLGGVHGSERVRLDLRLDKSQNTLNVSSEPSTLRLKLKDVLDLKNSDKTSRTDVVKNWKSGQLDNLELVLKQGQSYDFRIFYAERHTWKSVFQISTSIPLRPLPRATIKAIQPNAAEPTTSAAAVSGQFKVSLNEPAPKDLLVRFRLKGTAQKDVDYTLAPNLTEVLVAKGAQESGPIVVTPLADKLYQEGNETVIAELVLYGQCGYDLGSPAEDTIFIKNFVPPALPVVKIWASDPNAAEPGPGRAADMGSFTVEVTPKPAAGMVVKFGINTSSPGTAQTTDYTLTPTPAQGVWIDPATGRGTIWVTPLIDRDRDPNEMVAVYLIADSGYTLSTVPTETYATVIIQDVPPPVSQLPMVTIQAGKRGAVEPRPRAAVTPANQATFVVKLNQARPVPTTVSYRVTRNPVQGVVHAVPEDFVPFGNSITIPAGQLSATITVTVKADVAGNEPVERVMVELIDSPTSYKVPAVGAPGRADWITITDPAVSGLDPRPF